MYPDLGCSHNLEQLIGVKGATAWRQKHFTPVIFWQNLASQPEGGKT